MLQAVSLLPADAHVTGTPFMVVFGLTYNFLPFMCLPIYASLERLDLRYVEAGSDLYVLPAQRFRGSSCRSRFPARSRACCWSSSRPPATSSTRPRSSSAARQTTMAGNVINDLFFQSFYPVRPRCRSS